MVMKSNDSPNEITLISPALFYHALHTRFFPQTLVLHHLLIVVFTQNPPAFNKRWQNICWFSGVGFGLQHESRQVHKFWHESRQDPWCNFLWHFSNFLENIEVEYKKLHRAYCVGFKNNVFFLPIQYSHVSNQEYTKTQMFKWRERNGIDHGNHNLKIGKFCIFWSPQLIL